MNFITKFSILMTKIVLMRNDRRLSNWALVLKSSFQNATTILVISMEYFVIKFIYWLVHCTNKFLTHPSIIFVIVMIKFYSLLEIKSQLLVVFHACSGISLPDSYCSFFFSFLTCERLTFLLITFKQNALDSCVTSQIVGN